MTKILTHKTQNIKANCLRSNRSNESPSDVITSQLRTCSSGTGLWTLMILNAHVHMCGQTEIYLLSKDAGLLRVQISLMGHSSAASAPAGELMGQIVFCFLPSWKGWNKGVAAHLRNCKQSGSALTGSCRRPRQDCRNKYSDYCLQQEETHPKITGEPGHKVAPLRRQ